MFVQETGSIFGFEKDDLQRIALAVEEAIVNVMEHAFAGEEASALDMIRERLPYYPDRLVELNRGDQLISLL